jgi:hypothetical protein
MRSLGLILAGLLFLAPPARSEPRLTDFTATLVGTTVEVRFRLADAFTRETVERLASGLPTGFGYEVELLRDHKRWFDRELDDARLEVAAMYNAVGREYLVNTKLDGKLIESTVYRDLEELERAMTRFEALPLFDVAGMPSTRRLLLRARADLGAGTFLAFIPVRITTDWAETRKFYPPRVQ